MSQLVPSLARKLDGSWGRPGDPVPGMIGVNHFTPSGKEPEGANEGFLDGHVSWVRAALFVRYPKMDFDNVKIFFYGGDVNP